MSTSNNKTRKKSNSRGRRPNYNSRKQSEEREETNPKLDSKGRDNDPNWYFTSKELAEQAAQLSFQSILGTGTMIDRAEDITFMPIFMNPSPGLTEVPKEQGNDIPSGQISSSSDVAALPTEVYKTYGINLMITKVYTLLSTFSGRTSQYEPNDIATMILAISEVASLSEHIRRCFGLLLTFNQRNRSMPLNLIKALGVDVDDLNSNIADYRMKFNIQMTRINQIPLLDNVAYIKKCRDIYQRIYMDSPSMMAQIFFYRPYSTWIIDEESSSTGTLLKTVRIPDYAKMSDLLDILADQIDALLFSSTLQIVYSDILNLANKVKVPTWNFDYLAENYIVLPEYNRNASLQLHNLDITGWPCSTELPNVGNTVDNDVKSENGLIKYNPAFRYTGQTVQQTGTPNIVNYVGTLGHDTLVDFDTDAPTLEDKIECLRFANIASKYYYSQYTQEAANIHTRTTWSLYNTLTDHYVTRIMMFLNEVVINSDATGYDATTAKWSTNNVDKLSAGNEDQFYKLATLMTKIDHAPFFYISRNPQNHVEGIVGDTDFYTSVDWEYLVRINNLMTTGLFDFRV